MAGRKIEVGLYRCDWRWWWEEDRNSNVAQFNSANRVNVVKKRPHHRWSRFGHLDRPT
ncbi:MAG: hypothetical protein H6569_07650 [Lewinellaceae bacterium]|nr:hypothetical protein [Lewinellaceae bacterium]